VEGEEYEQQQQQQQQPPVEGEEHEQQQQRKRQQQREVYNPEYGEMGNFSAALDAYRYNLDILHEKFRDFVDLRAVEPAKTSFISVSLQQLLKMQNEELFRCSDALILLEQCSVGIEDEQPRLSQQPLAASAEAAPIASPALTWGMSKRQTQPRVAAKKPVFSQCGGVLISQEELDDACWKENQVMMILRRTEEDILDVFGDFTEDVVLECVTLTERQICADMQLLTVLDETTCQAICCDHISHT
jgi:hypothetical protein